ncbi:MAG: hypothetical protein JW946_02540 [Candidatus Omnitrophica bacterium]|nr:hypothetical protein [Candidatus Omnitrophota bacterium]
MKHIFIIFSLIIFTAVSFAQENDSEEASSGMEIIQVGNGQKLFVPKGTKIRRVGAQLILEDNAEYVATRISGLEARIEKLEAQGEELKQNVQDLKNSVKGSEGSKQD